MVADLVSGCQVNGSGRRGGVVMDKSKHNDPKQHAIIHLFSIAGSAATRTIQQCDTWYVIRLFYYSLF